MTSSEITIYIIAALVVIIANLGKVFGKKFTVSMEEDDEPKTRMRQSEYHTADTTTPSTYTPIPQNDLDLKVEHHDNAETTIDRDVKEIREHFDIKKAIIYKEILDPKYKQY